MEDLRELTDDEEFLEIINIAERRRRQQIFRPRENHFQKWNENEFVKRFRLTKDGVQYVLNEIRPMIASQTDRNHAVTPEEMLLLTLRFYATGSFLQVVGDFVGVDKGTASRIVTKVSHAIALLYPQHIKMPSNDDESNAVSQCFYNIARFPKCIGALDCTHIRILSPGGEEPEVYRNRKGFFSMNVQAICDASGALQNLVCRWPGSAHDATIFNNSQVRIQFENGAFGDKVLVGDSGCGVRNYLITPLTNPTTRAENLFNESQIRTRNPIERVFGVWKRRFPILAFGIRLKPEKIESVVIATAVLHNIGCLLKEPLPPLAEEEEVAINFAHNINNLDRHAVQLGYNNIARYQLIHDYFSTLV